MITLKYFFRILEGSFILCTAALYFVKFDTNLFTEKRAG